MARPGKSKVADKAGSTNAAKANPPPSQRTRLPDKKPNKTKDKTIQEVGENTEAAADGANVTRKNQYAVAFRRAVNNWKLDNSPENNRMAKRTAGPAEPTLAQYLGWLDSLKNRNEHKAMNTKTKKTWQKFCQQAKNKRMVTSWMEFARAVRTVDGGHEFRPAFRHVGTEPGGHARLHPLISFPSKGQVRENKKAALGGQVDSDDGVDGSEEDEAAIEPPTAAANKAESAASKKRSRRGTKGTPAGATKQTATDEDDADSSDRPLAISAKRSRTKKQQDPAPHDPMKLQLDRPTFQGDFDPEVEKRM